MPTRPPHKRMGARLSRRNRAVLRRDLLQEEVR